MESLVTSSIFQLNGAKWCSAAQKMLHVQASASGLAVWSPTLRSPGCSSCIVCKLNTRHLRNAPYLHR